MSNAPIAHAFHSPSFKDVVAGDLDLSVCKMSMVPVDLFKYQPREHQQTLSEIPRRAICGVAKPLEDATFTEGVLDACDMVFYDIPWGCRLGLVLVIDEGPGTSAEDLLFCADMGLHTTGGHIMINWDDGPLKIAHFWSKRKPLTPTSPF